METLDGRVFFVEGEGHEEAADDVDEKFAVDVGGGAPVLNEHSLLNNFILIKPAGCESLVRILRDFIPFWCCRFELLNS